MSICRKVLKIVQPFKCYDSRRLFVEFSCKLESSLKKLVDADRRKPGRIWAVSWSMIDKTFRELPSINVSNGLAHHSIFITTSGPQSSAYLF